MDLTRADWYPADAKFSLDPVTRSSGKPRSRLDVPLSRMLIHYIGAGSFLNRTDDAAILTSIELNHARPSQKPNEYNSGSGVNGQVCEYAGPWCAAHSSGKTDGVQNNRVWWGHVVFLGSPEVPTEEQADKLINGILRARRDLVALGWLTPDHIVEPHRNAPGLSTGTTCPGPLADNPVWWARISAPLDQPDLHATGSGAVSTDHAGMSAGVESDGRRTTVALDGEGWMAIARRALGSASRWQELRALNGDIAGPVAGQVVVLPD